MFREESGTQTQNPKSEHLTEDPALQLSSILFGDTMVPKIE